LGLSPGETFLDLAPVGGGKGLCTATGGSVTDKAGATQQKEGGDRIGRDRMDAEGQE
jgi:hypothetical protein